ncbi:MAG: glutamate--tRNA ligase, partial [Lachnospiraceae bacterium]|nr:glutamate--tRNA ligase [Lachnospiraceae bacterium]
PILREQNDYRNDALYERLQEYTKEKGYKNGYVLWPIRIAVSGKAMTPCGATEIMELLGKEETLARVQKAISLLQSACS